MSKSQPTSPSSKTPKYPQQPSKKHPLSSQKPYQQHKSQTSFTKPMQGVGVRGK